MRLPELDTIPLTPAFVALIDHPHFQRLRRVRQLGPTWLVYPGAAHTRFEHSLGVYGTAARYLRALLADRRVRDGLDAEDARTCLAAALLHDVGHYPFAHTLEALHRHGGDTPRHEDLAGDIIRGRAPGLSRDQAPLADVLARQTAVDPERVIALIAAPRSSLARWADRLSRSILSSAIDADKMDYLWRDSVHLGVPYGRNYDRERLLNALTLDAAGDHLAITDKGVVGAEIFLFCRYTMFSEVYWHHTVRSVSAMLEAALADEMARSRPSRDDLTARLLTAGDDGLLEGFAAAAPGDSAAARLLHGLTGDRRAPYKRLATFSRADAASGLDPLALWERLHALDGPASERLVASLSARLGGPSGPLPAGALILDVPPRDKDQIPDVPVHLVGAGAGEGAFTTLAARSTIVRGIAADFVSVVKKIRLFVHPDHAHHAASPRAVHAAVAAALDEAA